MSAENVKVCCNCRHCIRERDEKTLYTHCHCEIDKRYLSYVEVMEWWCRKWAKKKYGKNETD
jgi:hypothetical protein